MKKLFITAAICCILSDTFAQQFTLITTIESVVPAGLGRSRMVLTTSEGTKELPMQNFFSLVGINFSNVRQNDQMITDKITEMVKDGWDLINTISGVYSADKSTGIFITRYLFRKDEPAKE